MIRYSIYGLKCRLPSLRDFAISPILVIFQGSSLRPSLIIGLAMKLVESQYVTKQARISFSSNEIPTACHASRSTNRLFGTVTEVNTNFMTDVLGKSWSEPGALRGSQNGLGACFQIMMRKVWGYLAKVLITSSQILCASYRTSAALLRAAWLASMAKRIVVYRSPWFYVYIAKVICGLYHSCLVYCNANTESIPQYREQMYRFSLRDAQA